MLKSLRKSNKVPIYEDKTITREQLFELRKENRCQVCGASLNVYLDQKSGKAFIACWDYNRTQHEGIEREAPPPFEPNIPTRRKDMVEEIGEVKTAQLAKYEGVVSLTKLEAMEILKTIWPEAPEIEVLKAGIICHQYGLNPLMKHIHLVKFNKWNREHTKVIGEDWSVIQGIGSNRLIARRKHNYSYLDLSPRRMTEDEQVTINGEIDNSKIWALTILKDVDTGAEAPGVGSWPVSERPHGMDKGNTKLNMARIRSERQALDRLYPAEMPQGIEVMEEQYIDAAYQVVGEEERGAATSKIGGEKIGGVAEKTGGEEGKAATTNLSPPNESEPRKNGAPTGEPAHPNDELEGDGFHINLPWLSESLKALKWSDDTCKSYLVGKYKVSIQGSPQDVLKRLTREQAEEFVTDLRNKLEKQPKLIF